MTERDPDELTQEEWEKKAEIALQNGNMGEAIKYSHKANVAELGYDPLEEGGLREEDEGYTPGDHDEG